MLMTCELGSSAPHLPSDIGPCFKSNISVLTNTPFANRKHLLVRNCAPFLAVRKCAVLGKYYVEELN